MRRREVFLGFAGLAIAWPFSAGAQQASKPVARVGALIGFAENDPATQRRVAAFKTGLADLGWVVDRNIAIEFRYGSGNAEKNRVLAKELVSLKPDVIFVNSTSATAAVLRETKTIPVVFATVSDPVGSGFVASLARPGGNVTGFVNVEGTIAGKWLGLLKEMAPGIRAAGLMYNPTTATYFQYYLKPFEAAAEAAGVKHFSLPVSNVEDIARAFETRKPDEGIVLMSDPFLTVNAGLTNEKALQFRVPAVSGVSQSGALISYAPDTEELFRRSTAYVDKILRGASPADLPVQLPTKFELIINLKTAKALGLNVPQTLIAEADEVIE
ncbi:MAG TPA: ABC transporter substrate-binding protein [Bradyrhizobium sp.]|jgi:putative ABC transport system substrate-binding protein|nr:ABC transporter substrate-binding protein [Bradyrhizobium sp.]